MRLLLLAVAALAALCYGDVRAGLEALYRGDRDAALREIRASATEGDAEAQFLLGKIYEEMEGFEHDFAEAMRWYREAAGQKHPAATFAIGVLHEFGRGVEPDLDEATAWYRRAADLGHHEQRITTVRVRWYPGPEELHLEPPPDPWLPESPTAEELDRLRDAGLHGRLVMNGYSIDGRGLRSRAVVVMHRQVEEPVRLAAPDNSCVVLVQREDAWERLPGDAPVLPRSIVIAPQPDTPVFTLVSVELFGGGSTGGVGFGWK
ncbi:MAG TPA: tetratricopeptide repeat protein [Bryobacteraceae bacterium]|nr:tetratricopeptide repeat protein [Bryobacteraceae bacterium]